MIAKADRHKGMINRPLAPRTVLTLACSAAAVLTLLAIAPTPAWSQPKATPATKTAEFPRPSDLPAEALIVHSATLKAPADRALILWMLNPEKHPWDADEGDYGCPSYTRGSYYSGPTRVSLVNTKTSTIINTVEVKQEY